MDFDALRQLDAVSSGRIESLDDARAYVRKSAALCGVADPALVSDDLESRLVAAEFDAARDPSKLVSDDRVAEAFNFMSDEFRVEHPARLTASDILQYRSVMASIFPHVFSPRNMSGSRPVGAIVMLYMLIYNGGITDGVRKAAQLDRPPGSLKVTGGYVMARTGTGGRTEIEMEYRKASRSYFQQQSPQGVRSFGDRLAGIMTLTDRK